MLGAPVASAPLSDFGRGLVPGIGLACLNVELLESLVGLWPLHHVQLIFELVDQQKHCPNGQEPVQVDVFDQVWPGKDHFVEEVDHKGWLDPLGLQDYTPEPAVE